MVSKPNKVSAEEEWNVEKLKHYAYETALEAGVDPYMILAQISMESRWDVDAVNCYGNCFGLMQINPTWQGARMEELGLDDLRDPVQNITCGVDYMKDLIDQYGDVHTALMAYNGGPQYVLNLHRSGVYTTGYSRWIMSYAETLRAEDESQDSIIPRK